MLELDTATIRQSKYDIFKGQAPASITVTEFRPIERQKHAYKPIALKLPSLILFLSIFALCIGMIEWLLAETRDSGNSTTTAATTSRSMVRRSNCLSNSDYSGQLGGLESQYSNLCSQFSKTYAPVSTNLTPSLQSSFDQWNGQMNNLLASKIALSSSSQSCQSISVNLPVTVVATAGCGSSTETFSQSDCTLFTGGLILVGSAISTTWAQPVCTASKTTQALIATTTASSTGQTFNLNTSVSTSSTSVITQVLVATSTVSSSANTPITSPASTTVAITSHSSSKITPTSKTETLPTITIAATSSSTGDVPVTSGPLPVTPDPPISINNTPVTPVVVTIYGTGTLSSIATYYAFSTVTEYTSLVPTTDSTGSTSSVLAIVEQTVVMTSTSKPDFTRTDLITNTKTATAAPTTILTGVLAVPAQEKDVNPTFTTWTYFAAMYLAPIIAIFIKALYEALVASVKIVEPFQRMSNPSGATAAYSVFAQYLSSSISADAFRALMYGHLLPFWSTVMYIFVGIGAPVASAAMNVRSRSTCLVDGVEKTCDPVWVVNLVVIRFLEGILALCLLVVVFLIYATWKYYIPVASNPSSIVSIATLLNHQPLLHDLQSIDPDADDDEFESALQRHLFWIEEHEDLITHHQHFGIVGYKYSEHRRRVPQLLDRFKSSRESLVVDYVPVTDLPPPPRSPPPSSFTPTVAPRRISRKTTSLIADLLLIFIAFALLVLLLAYSFDYKVDSFDNFFNSQKVIPKIIFVGLAAIADAQMKRLERVVRITEPYRRLSLGDAIPETTILLSLNGTCWSNLPRCIYYFIRYPTRSMGWQTTTTLAASLSDLNIIAVAGVLFAEAQTARAFQICAYVAIVLTAMILVVSLIAVLWWRRSPVLKQMPRRPETIGAVLSYLCGSHLVRDWMIGMEMEKMTAKERKKFIINSSRSFCFRRMPGIDDRLRWCVDFERDDDK